MILILISWISKCVDNKSPEMKNNMIVYVILGMQTIALLFTSSTDKQRKPM